MSNMSYCRFQNTERDFDDCKVALFGMIDEPNEYGALSREELNAAKRLALAAIELLQTLCDHAGIDTQTLFDSASIQQHEVETILDNINQTVKTAAQEEQESEDE